MSQGQVVPSIPVTAWRGTALLSEAQFAEAEETLLPLAASWEKVNPEGAGRGEVLHWLARAEQGLGKGPAAHRDAQLANALLRRSTLPALRRLIVASPTPDEARVRR
jgi:hypothetical protein